MSDNKEYLGDGVYADFDDFHIILSAYNNGQNNTIYLEPHVMKALLEYENHLKSRGGK